VTISRLNSVLPRSFYDRSPLRVGRELIGKKLVRLLPQGTELSGIIVEVEAYGGNKDPASHAYKGETLRNAVMFGEAGHAYVYFTYGAHYCLNFVTSSKYSKASAVLIRAMEPLAGVEFMESRRGTKNISQLASGPGKLTQALQIDRALNGIDVTLPDAAIRVEQGVAEMKVGVSKRIGIHVATERKWRFYADLNPHVSKLK
jgi:DNA-3-methyladenine glycosylase